MADGARRKVRRDWAAVLEAQAASGQTAGTSCRGHDIPYKTFLYHRRKAEATEEDTPVASSSAEPSVEVKAHRRRGKPKRIALSADLPREEVVIELPEGERVCPEDHALREIGQEVSERLEVIPEQVKVIRTVRKTYACPVCGDCVKRAPLPETAIPKSIAGPGLLAHIATSKYGDGLPLYRQEGMWQRLGVELPRTTSGRTSRAISRTGVWPSTTISWRT